MKTIRSLATLLTPFIVGAAALPATTQAQSPHTVDAKVVNTAPQRDAKNNTVKENGKTVYVPNGGTIRTVPFNRVSENPLRYEAQACFTPGLAVIFPDQFGAMNIDPSDATKFSGSAYLTSNLPTRGRDEISATYPSNGATVLLNTGRCLPTKKAPAAPVQVFATKGQLDSAMSNIYAAIARSDSLDAARDRAHAAADSATRQAILDALNKKPGAKPDSTPAPGKSAEPKKTEHHGTPNVLLSAYGGQAGFSGSTKSGVGFKNNFPYTQDGKSNVYGGEIVIPFSRNGKMIGYVAADGFTTDFNYTENGANGSLATQADRKMKFTSVFAEALAFPKGILGYHLMRDAAHRDISEIIVKNGAEAPKSSENPVAKETILGAGLALGKPAVNVIADYLSQSRTEDFLKARLGGLRVAATVRGELLAKPLPITVIAAYSNSDLFSSPMMEGPHGSAKYDSRLIDVSVAVAPIGLIARIGNKAYHGGFADKFVVGARYVNQLDTHASKMEEQFLVPYVGASLPLFFGAKK